MLRNYARVLPEQSTFAGYQPRDRCILATLSYETMRNLSELVMCMSGVLGRCIVCQCHMAPDLLPAVPITRNYLVRAPPVPVLARTYSLYKTYNLMSLNPSPLHPFTPSSPPWVSQEASVEQVQAQRNEIEAKKDKRPAPKGMGFMGDVWQKVRAPTRGKYLK